MNPPHQICSPFWREVTTIWLRCGQLILYLQLQVAPFQSPKWATWLEPNNHLVAFPLFLLKSDPFFYGLLSRKLNVIYCGSITTSKPIHQCFTKGGTLHSWKPRRFCAAFWATWIQPISCWHVSGNLRSIPEPIDKYHHGNSKDFLHHHLGEMARSQIICIEYAWVCNFTGISVFVGQHSMVPHHPMAVLAPILLWWWVALVRLALVAGTLVAPLAVYDGAEPEMRNKHIQKCEYV